MADPYYQNVQLLLRGGGADGSTVFTDSSRANRTVTGSANCTVSTTQSKNGGSSVKFAAGSGYLNVPYTENLEPLAGDFAYEMWFRVADVSSSKTLLRFQVNNKLDIRLNGPYIAVYAGSNESSFDIINGLTGTTAVAVDTWYHCAFTRSGTTWTIWLNGLVDNQVTGVSGTIVFRNVPNYDLQIGRRSDDVGIANAYMDDIRVTLGVGRYTAPFDPNAIDYEAPGASVVPPAVSASAYGGGSLNIIVPYARAFAGYPSIAVSTITAPSPTLSSYGGGNASITAPSPTLHVTAHGSYGERDASITTPKPQLSIFGGGRAALTAPSPNLTSTATGTALAVANLTAPSPTVEALGTVSNVANISITIPGPNVLAYAGSVCSVTIAGVTVQATGTGGGVAHAAITIPLFQLDAQGTAQNHGGANISAPMPVISTGGVTQITIPMATLTVIGTATVVATYEAYALNLKHTAETNDEVTHYTNFPFTHIVRYKDRYYGANTTGLYLLEGTTDDGAAIEWAFKTGMTDFDSPQLKTVTYAYFGGRMGPDATVTIYPSEPTWQSYAYTTPRGQTAQNYRQQFGKGLKARYYAIGASGADALELDSLDLTVATLTRRI